MENYAQCGILRVSTLKVNNSKENNFNLFKPEELALDRIKDSFKTDRSAVGGYSFKPVASFSRADHPMIVRFFFQNTIL